ncbi:MAG: phage portal protein, partial [Varibaculum cambriense]|nr:phage portal protein [Varibaculum cambriense]
KFLGLDAKAGREWARKTSREFDLWAASKNCDLYRRNNFYDLQFIAYSTYLTDGDSFSLFRRKNPTFDMPYSLRIQLLEANRVSNPINQGYVSATSAYAVEMKAPNGNRIVNGVEIAADGEIVAFWISNKVPDDLTDDRISEWVRVEAFGERTGLPNILQICHDTRAEQYRGVPYLAPVLETLKQVSRYTTAELTSAIIKSFFALFFTSQAGSSDLDNILGTQGDKEDPMAPVVDVSEYGLAPGTMNALPRGVDVKSVDASNSQSTFEPFVTQLIKQIAAAIGQPYEVLLKSFTSSYSASRAALLQAWEEYKLRRKWFASDFCQPVYETWLAEAVAIGRIEAPGF